MTLDFIKAGTPKMIFFSVSVTFLTASWYFGKGVGFAREVLNLHKILHNSRGFNDKIKIINRKAGEYKWNLDLLALETWPRQLLAD